MKKNIEDIVRIDGSQGEGGGQMLRSALTLSMQTGRPFTIENIRAKRKKPGLMRQHLTAVKAAARISSAQVEGADLGAQELKFSPSEVNSGEYHFAVGTAGSTTLILQTILLPLCLADKPSIVVLEGGTHNAFAPPFDFMERVFAPIINRMGARINMILEKPGFYPAGGGRVKVEISPVDKLNPISILDRGELKNQKTIAIVNNLADHIAERELKKVQQKLNLKTSQLVHKSMTSGEGPGNILFVELEYENVTEIMTGFGEHRKAAEVIAGEVCDTVIQYLKDKVPVGEYLSDQLLLPMCLAGKGAFRTNVRSTHFTTNCGIIKEFLPVEITTTQKGRRDWLVEIK